MPDPDPAAIALTSCGVVTNDKSLPNIFTGLMVLRGNTMHACIILHRTDSPCHMCAMRGDTAICRTGYNAVTIKGVIGCGQICLQVCMICVKRRIQYRYRYPITCKPSGIGSRGVDRPQPVIGVISCFPDRGIQIFIAAANASPAPAPPPVPAAVFSEPPPEGCCRYRARPCRNTCHGCRGDRPGSRTGRRPGPETTSRPHRRRQRYRRRAA